MSRKIHSMVMIAMFGAIISIISMIPIGIYLLGVPVTLQTFAVAMTAYALGNKDGTKATLVYILLGIIGLPVFSGFQGGPGVILSMTGGFIVGFIAIAFFCGYAVKVNGAWKKAIVSFIGLLICYIIGTIWFAYVSDMSLYISFVTMALPYLPKDVLSLMAAYVVAKKIKKNINIKRCDYEQI